MFTVSSPVPAAEYDERHGGADHKQAATYSAAIETEILKDAAAERALRGAAMSNIDTWDEFYVRMINRLIAEAGCDCRTAIKAFFASAAAGHR